LGSALRDPVPNTWPALFCSTRRKYLVKTSMPCESTSWQRVSVMKQGHAKAQTWGSTHLPDLLCLGVPLGAVFVVLQWSKLAEQ
jgi:hypothetical protein